MPQTSEGPDDDTQAPDPFVQYRQPVQRNFWMTDLESTEPGELLPREAYSRVNELLYKDGVATHLINGRGELVLLVAVPEEQLPAFEEGDWRVGHRVEGVDQMVFVIVVGIEKPLEVPFVFDLGDSDEMQEAFQLADLNEVDLFGATHTPEGLLLTIKAQVGLPAAFHREMESDLLLTLGR